MSISKRLRETWPFNAYAGPVTTAQRQLANDAATLIDTLQAELENERMRLAACGVAAVGSCEGKRTMSFPTWQCPNCGTVDEFSVQHCAPDDLGAIYSRVECHVCGLICSGESGEKARDEALKSMPAKGVDHGG